MSDIYQPYDLSSIPTPKIYSDKDLENEVNKIVDILKDTQTNDWKKRTDCLKKVQEISVLYFEIADGNSNIDGSHYLNQLNRLFAPLTAQALDLRSATAKEGGKAIQIMAQALGQDFESLAVKFLTKDSLIKLLHCGTKVLAEIGNTTIISILSCRFQEEMKVSKNTWAHSKLAHYLYLILAQGVEQFDQYFEKQQTLIESFLQQCLSDANPEARLKGRKAFLEWVKISPQTADNLFKILDYAIQKAILEERDTIQTEIQIKPIQQQQQQKVVAQQERKKPQQQQNIPKEEVKEKRQGTSQVRSGQLQQQEQQQQRQRTPVKSNNQNVKMKSPSADTNRQAQKQQQIQNIQQHQQNNEYQNPFQVKLQTKQENSQVFSLKQVLIKLKSQVWYQKLEALEEMLRNLIEYEQSQLQQLFEHDKVFNEVVDVFVNSIENESVFKVVEVSLDVLEFLLSSLPECLFNHIETLISCLIKLLQNRKESISSKANDLLNLAQDIMSADVILPHLVSILESISNDQSQLKSQISALEVLNLLIKNASDLDQEVQYDSIISVIGGVLQNHASQKSIQMPSLGALLALRDKNINFTIKAISDLPVVQLNIIKQLSNAYENSLARQLLDFQQANIQKQAAQRQKQLEEMKVNQQNQYQQQQQLQQAPLLQNRVQSQQIEQKQVQSPITHVLQNQTNQKQNLVVTLDVSKSMSQNIVVPVQKMKENKEKQIQITPLSQFHPQNSLMFNQSTEMSINADLISPLKQSNIGLAQEIVNSYSMLKDPKSSIQQKQQGMIQIQKLNQQFNLSVQGHQDSWSATIESIMDHLFFLSSQPQEPQVIKELAFDTVTSLIQKQPRDRLLQFSTRFPDIQIRHKIFQFALQNYVSSLSLAQSQNFQCQINQPIDELLESLSLKSDMKFISDHFALQMNQEQPPKLQALLRVITSRVKNINSVKVEMEFKYESYQQIVESIMSMMGPMTNVINHNNADVRKCAVFCLVEIQNIIGEDLFVEFMNKLNPSQQKLVDIYLKRKKETIEKVW